MHLAARAAVIYLDLFIILFSIIHNSYIGLPSFYRGSFKMSHKTENMFSVLYLQF